MIERDVNTAAQLWVRESHAAAVDLPWDAIETALRQLPTPAACAVSDDATALFLLGQTDTLFTVSADGGKVKLTSQPLNGDRLTVGLELSEATSGTRATRWTFLYEGEPEPSERWQMVSGSVAVDADAGRESLDEREHFARMLASRAGWSDYVDGAARARATGEQPATAAEDVEQPESRWRAMTDVWGKPLREPRR